MEFIINEFLKNAKEITLTNGKMIDEQGNERTPKISTPQQLKNGGIYCYKNLNNDVIIESLESDEKIKSFIKSYCKKEKYARAKEKARAQIIDILEQNRDRAMSWGELAEQQTLIYKIAKRCGLVKELHNEGII